MPIFGTSTASGRSAKVESARGYSDHDLGRILSECAINDMRVFNAGIARDFQEATAIHEGTMVKSELQAFQEFSLKDAWSKIKEKLKKLWSKIKGVFRQVYAKLSLWLNRNVKAYIAQNKKYLMTKKNLDAAKCPKYRKPKSNIANLSRDYANWLKENSAAVKNMKNDSIKDTAIANATENDTDYSDIINEYFDEPNSDATWSNIKDSVGGLQGLFNNLSDSSKYLKEIKKNSKEADKVLKDLIKWCDKKSNEASKKDGYDSDNDDYKKASTGISNFQTGLTKQTNAMIKVIKKGISNDRGLIAALVAHNPDKSLNDAAMMEFAFQAGAAAYFHEVDDMSEEEVESAAEEEGINITIEIENDSDADVEVNDDEA